MRTILLKMFLAAGSAAAERSIPFMCERDRISAEGARSEPEQSSDPAPKPMIEIYWVGKILRFRSADEALKAGFHL